MSSSFEHLPNSQHKERLGKKQFQTRAHSATHKNRAESFKKSAALRYQTSYVSPYKKQPIPTDLDEIVYDSSNDTLVTKRQKIQKQKTQHSMNRNKVSRHTCGRENVPTHLKSSANQHVAHSSKVDVSSELTSDDESEFSKTIHTSWSFEDEQATSSHPEADVDRRQNLSECSSS